MSKFKFATLGQIVRYYLRNWANGRFGAFLIFTTVLFLFLVFINWNVDVRLWGIWSRIVLGGGTIFFALNFSRM